MSNQYRAFVMGGTGATGRALINELLQSPHCGSIVSLSRRPVFGDKEKPEKLQEVIVKDFDDVLKPRADISDDVKKTFSNVDVAFNCLGSTRAKAGSAEAFQHFDKDYVLWSADLLKKYSSGTLRQFQLLTASSSNKNSWFLYPRTKGEVEEGIRDMHFPRTSVFRPALLITPQGREESRFGESVAQTVFPYIDWILAGPMRRYRSISVNDVAKAMRLDWERTFLQQQKGLMVERFPFIIYESEEIQDLADSAKE